MIGLLAFMSSMVLATSATAQAELGERTVRSVSVPMTRIVAPTGVPLLGGVSACWNIGSLTPEAQGVSVVVAFDMTSDGRPVEDTLRLVSFDGGSETAAQQAYQAARRAILRCGANGYDVSAHQGLWPLSIEITFDPSGPSDR